MASKVQESVKLAVNHHLSGDTELASQLYMKILANSPDNLTVLVNQGVILLEAGQISEAMRFFERVLQISPNDIEAINNYGNCLQELGRTKDAIQQFDKAHKLDPKNSAVSANLGRVLLRKGDYKSAIQILEYAIKRDPDDHGLRFINALALPVIPENSKQLLEARKRQFILVNKLRESELKLINPINQVGMTNFLAGYHGYNERTMQKTLAECFENACPELNFIAPHIHESRKKKNIRIGFISIHLNSHTITKLFQRLILNFDTKKFQKYLFCPETNPVKRDQIVQKFKPLKKNIYFTLPKLESLRSAISEKELDVLYFLDIGMEPLTYFLSFSRLARIQCVAFGHPVTTGVPTIDYFISSELIESKFSQSHYTEKLIQLNTFPTDYSQPILPGRTSSQENFMFNTKSNIYFCPQSLFKIHPSFDRIIGKILTGDPNGEVIFIEGQQREWARQLRNRLKKTIPDAMHRIQFLPRLSGSDFLNSLCEADIVLDTIHFSGGNSSYEAFACGKIVITLPGKFMRSRVTSGLYSQMGIKDLVAKNSQEYIKLAIHYGTNREARISMEERILEANSKIFNTTNAINDHERIFENLSKFPD